MRRSKLVGGGGGGGTCPGRRRRRKRSSGGGGGRGLLFALRRSSRRVQATVRSRSLQWSARSFRRPAREGWRCGGPKQGKGPPPPSSSSSSSFSKAPPLLPHTHKLDSNSRNSSFLLLAAQLSDAFSFARQVSLCLQRAACRAPSPSRKGRARRARRPLGRFGCFRSGGGGSRCIISFVDFFPSSSSSLSFNPAKLASRAVFSGPGKTHSDIPEALVARKSDGILWRGPGAGADCRDPRRRRAAERCRKKERRRRLFLGGGREKNSFWAVGARLPPTPRSAPRIRPGQSDQFDDFLLRVEGEGHRPSRRSCAESARESRKQLLLLLLLDPFCFAFRNSGLERGREEEEEEEERAGREKAAASSASPSSSPAVLLAPSWISHAAAAVTHRNRGEKKYTKRKRKQQLPPA